MKLSGPHSAKKKKKAMPQHWQYHKEPQGAAFNTCMLTLLTQADLTPLWERMCPFKAGRLRKSRLHIIQTSLQHTGAALLTISET